MTPIISLSKLLLVKGLTHHHFENIKIIILEFAGLLELAPLSFELKLKKSSANLGKHYDQKNIIDIVVMLLPSLLNLFKKRSITACLGKCNEFQVICSGMAAQAFQSVGYPIFPDLKSTQEDDKTLKKSLRSQIGHATLFADFATRF